MVDNDFTDKEFVDEGDDDVDFFDSRDDAVEDANDAKDGSYSEGSPARKRKRKRKKGAKGMMTVMPACPPVEVPMDNYALLKNQQRKLPWHMHQSKAVLKKGKCRWDNCPGKLMSKAAYPRSSDTHMCCKECSAHWGKDVFLCNGYVNGAPVNCHWHYHICHHNKEFASTMVIN